MFFHNGSFSNIRDVVRYFNDGVPQDAEFAGQAATLEPRFTHPRGDRAPRGLGLSPDQIDALADFLNDGLYDPTFVDAFQPNAGDLTYSQQHPELVALGAKDGQLLSGRAVDNDDPLSRRDQGLEFLDVTRQLGVDRVGHVGGRLPRGGAEEVYRLTNTSDAVVDTDLLIVVRGLPAGVRLTNASGTTRAGEPYLRVFLPGGVLEPGRSLTQRFGFNGSARPGRLTLTLLSGQGDP